MSTELCPGGYELRAVVKTANSQQGFTCQCVDIPEIVGCEENQDDIIIKVCHRKNVTILGDSESVAAISVLLAKETLSINFK